MNETNKYVVIIGSSNMDLNIYSERLPTPGETVTGGTFRQFLGGKGANQAVASVRSGASTFFIGKIGEDSYGDQMKAQLTEEGINTDFILRDPEAASGIAFILIDKKGENMISVAPGANHNLKPAEIEKHASFIQNASVVVAQMEIPIETIQRIFGIASRGKAIKILNPAPLRPLPREILQLVDIIVPNEGELFRLHSLLGFEDIIDAGMRDKIIDASKDICSLGIGTVITTLGPKGCFVYQGDTGERFELSAYKVDAVDTVGAGDCFNGVLAAKICEDHPLKEATTYALCAASIAVTRKGAQASMPYSSEIEQRYREYQKIVKSSPP